MGSTIIAAVAVIGILATATSFYAVCTGAKKVRLAALVLASAVLVGASPFVALTLGTSGQSTLRGLVALGLASFVIGLLAYFAAVVLAKQWTPLVSAVPMTALAAWSFFFLAIFSTGVA